MAPLDLDQKTELLDLADLTLRERQPHDLPTLWRWLHGTPNAEWRQWDAPYFHKEKPTPLTLQEFIEQAQAVSSSPDRKIIAVNDSCIGQVTRFWEEPSAGGWMELGIVIFDPQYWGRSIGTSALARWTDDTFREHQAHVLTLTTWSGNERMMRAARRLGFRECARIREARLWRGRRHDSVKLDLLHREWYMPSKSVAPLAGSVTDKT